MDPNAPKLCTTKTMDSPGKRLPKSIKSPQRGWIRSFREIYKLLKKTCFLKRRFYPAKRRFYPANRRFSFWVNFGVNVVCPPALQWPAIHPILLVNVVLGKNLLSDTLKHVLLIRHSWQYSFNFVLAAEKHL